MDSVAAIPEGEGAEGERRGDHHVIAVAGRHQFAPAMKSKDAPSGYGGTSRNALGSEQPNCVRHAP